MDVTEAHHYHLDNYKVHYNITFYQYTCHLHIGIPFESCNNIIRQIHQNIVLYHHISLFHKCTGHYYSETEMVLHNGNCNKFRLTRLYNLNVHCNAEKSRCKSYPRMSTELNDHRANGLRFDCNTDVSSNFNDQYNQYDLLNMELHKYKLTHQDNTVLIHPTRLNNLQYRHKSFRSWCKYCRDTNGHY